MQFMRCKCGDRSAWTSMGVNRCDRCPKCKSDLALGPAQHAEPALHAMTAVEHVDTDNGPRPLTRCVTCHRTLAEILRRDPDAEFA